MTKILIVDDEQIEREGIAAILRHAFPQLQIDQAKNGKLAVEMIAQLQPDLVLMDIKMPGMSGLEATELISKDYPDIKFIMVTAYDTFEFARTAIKLGVKDYLLKPSKASEIVATVRRVLQEIEEEKRTAEMSSKQQEALHKLLPVIEADLVTQLLLDYVHDVHIDELLQLMNMRGDHELFVLTMMLPHASDRLYSRIRERAKKFSSCWVGALNGRFIPIIVFRQENQSYRTQAIMLARELLAAAGQPLDTSTANEKGINEASVAQQAHCFIGIGGLCQSLDQIRQSYQEALIASLDPSLPVKYQFYADSNVLSMARERVSVNQWERQFFDRIRQGHWEQIEADLLELLRWCENDRIVPHIAQQRALELLWLVTRVLTEMGVEVETQLFSSQAVNYEGLRQEATLLLSRLQQSAKAYQAKIKPDAINQMKQYIYEHSHQDISLETIAGQLGLSSVYVSKMFKEQLGINYIDFLTQCRIDKAKKLMANPELSLKEITFEVGYHDPNYFSKVFKRLCDVSPTEYRRKIFGKRGGE